MTLEEANESVYNILKSSPEEIVAWVNNKRDLKEVVSLLNLLYEVVSIPEDIQPIVIACQTYMKNNYPEIGHTKDDLKDYRG